MSRDISDHQAQSAKTSKGNITQVGGNYTQTTNTRIGIWISITVVIVVAIASSVLIRLQSDNGSFIDIWLREESAHSNAL